MQIRRTIALGGVLALAAGAPATAQQRAPSPDGLASTEVGGRYEGARTPYYVGGRWIEVSYGRPIKRGRDLWGSGSAYGVWLNRGAPVWRAGADVSTYLMTEAPLLIGGTRIEPGGYTMFIDLEPDDWTLIISNWQPQSRYDPNDRVRLWGSYGYTRAKDVVRVPMELSELPWSVDQLTWLFLDVTDTAGRFALMWDTVMAAVAFDIAPEPADVEGQGPTVDPRSAPIIRNAPGGAGR